MRSSLAVLIALLPAVILAQPAREAKEATDLPCKLTDFRIARSSAAGPPDTVAVRCDGTELADFAAPRCCIGWRTKALLIRRSRR